MRQEEKAKAYDEAIEKAKKELNTCGSQDCDSARQIFRLFPELKESEDERIRKTLIEYFNAYPKDYYAELKRSHILAWLEKQGEKETSCDRCRKAQPSHSCQDITELGRCYLEHEKQSEQKFADNIKTKFKIGYWIVDNDTKDVFLIKSINNGYYTLEDIKGNIISPCLPPCESESHIWTIQDAMDGDVLVDICDDFVNPFILILKKFEHKDFGLAKLSDYSSYCYLTMSDNQKFKEGFYHHMHNIHPATKEQRDLLFQKMKEYGYEWNADDKKLIKVEQNTDSGSCSLDEDMIKSICEGLQDVFDEFGWSDFGNTPIHDIIDWLKKIEQRIG